MKKTVFIFSFLFVLALSSIAQNSIPIAGRVLSESTKEPVPYAHLNIVGTGIGTIANSEGWFKLIVSLVYEGKQIKISCIGYADHFITIKKGGEENSIILLEESSNTLSSVTIKPDDLAKKIILQAIENIPINYPSNKEILKGFLTERVYPDINNLDAPFYIAEAVVEAYKNSYSQISTQGDIKLLKGRRFIGDNIDSLPVRFYGGVHEPHQFDFVMRRHGPLDKNKIDRFFFEIEDTLKYGNKDIVVIAFSPRKSAAGSGKLYIDINSYSVTKIKIHYKGNEGLDIFDKLSSISNDFKRSYRHMTVEYATNDSLWRLKYILYNTHFQSSRKENIFLKTDFVTTDYYQQEDALPYLERFQYRDVFLNNTGKYDEDFWKGYNTILPDIEVKENHKTYTESGRKFSANNKQEKILRIIQKLRLTYSLFYFKSNYRPSGISMLISEVPATFQIEKQTHHYLGLSSSLQYKFSDRFFVGLENQGSFSNERFSGDWLTLGYETNLRPQKRPVYLSPAIKIGYVKQRLYIDRFSNEGEVKINKKTFDSKKIDVFYESQGFSIIPSFAIAIEKNNRLRYFLGMDLPLLFKSKEGLYLREKEFFMTRKSTFVKEGEYRLTFENDVQSTFHNSLAFSGGIMLTF